ncbi:MAG: YCF48-related protein [Ignavibacteria bacterium]
MNKLFTTFLIIISAITMNLTAQSIWQWQQPQPTGNLMDAMDFVDENTGYAAGVLGTVLKTTNGGLNWNVKNISPNIQLLGIHFINGMTGFVVGNDNGKMYKTSDGGENWNLVLTANSTLWDLDFATNTLGFAVGLEGKIFKSTDGGNLWNQISSQTLNPLFCIDMYDSLNGMVGGRNYLSKTTNGGINWVVQNITYKNVFSQIVSINFVNFHSQFALPVNDDSLFLTTNGGLNWFGKFMPEVDFDAYRAISFINPDTGLLVTDYGRLRRTYNAGTNWITNSTYKPRYSQPNILWAGELLNSNVAYACGAGGRVVKSTDGAVTWFTTTGGNENFYSNYFINSNTGFTVGTDGKILKTTNAGVNWIEKQSNTLQRLREVDFPSVNIGYTCGDTGTVLKSTDEGESWSDISPGGTNNFFGLDFIDEQTGYISGGNSARILKTTNGGVNWEDQVIGVNPLAVIGPLIFVNHNSGFTAGDENLRTTNGGVNWILNTQGAGIDLFFPSYVTGYHTSGSGLILKTTNAGINYFAQNGNVSSNLNSIFFLDDNNGFATGNSGVITKTTNGGVLWIAQEKVTLNDLKSVFFTDADNGYIAGDFGTILKTTNGGLVFISNNSSTSVPEEHTLYQNYPNPFNSSTVIKYKIKKPGFIELKLYNISGKEIIKLVNENQTQGDYSVLFSPNENEVQLNSGIYFYSLFLNNTIIKTNKLILIK